MSTRRTRLHHPAQIIDDRILEGIWSQMRAHDTIRAIEVRHIHVEVNEGQVRLSGHMSRGSHVRQIQEIAAGIAAVKSIENELVADSDLRVEVAQALGADEQTRPYVLPVGAFHGWIHLGGEVPTAELRAAAERVAASVSRVRGVVAVPHVAGEPPASIRRRLQPLIGSVVYARDGRVGEVSAVVLDPTNRLVKHIAVATRVALAKQETKGEFVIPADAIKLVNETSVLLEDAVADVARRSRYRPEDYPPAPRTWKPPFPYPAGGVRWSREMMGRSGLLGS